MIYTIKNEYDLQPMLNYAKRILKERHHVIIAVDETKLKRSIKQNNYYRGVIVKMSAEYTGYSTAEQHQVFQKHVLGYKELICNGRVDQVLISTTELNTTEFEHFTEHCRVLANGWYGLEIPLPNETIEYYRKPPENGN